MATGAINSVFDGIRTDFDRAAREGLESAAQILPEVMRANIDSHGDNTFPDVPINWLRERVTWPGDREGPTTPAQRSYEKNHTPLRDTDNLYNDMQIEEIPGGYQAYPAAEYAAEHVLGIPGLDGPIKLWKRDFVYLNPKDEETAVAIFEAVFERVLK